MSFFTCFVPFVLANFWNVGVMEVQISGRELSECGRQETVITFCIFKNIIMITSWVLSVGSWCLFFFFSSHFDTIFAASSNQLQWHTLASLFICLSLSVPFSLHHSQIIMWAVFLLLFFQRQHKINPTRLKRSARPPTSPCWFSSYTRSTRNTRNWRQESAKIFRERHRKRNCRPPWWWKWW